MKIDREEAVSQFLAIARYCEDRRLKAADIMREMVGFWEDVRILSADDYDELQFQWGVSEHLLLSGPTDIRRFTDDQLKFDHIDSPFVEFSRLVFAPGDDSEAEFDDLVIHMSIILLYGPADREDRYGDLRISSPDQLRRGVHSFLSEPFLVEKLDITPSRYMSSVGHAG
jgi:hypothetical protein